MAAAPGYVRPAPPPEPAFRQATFAQLTEAQREQFTSFRNKATGWFTVAAGVTLLAAGETWQIVEHHGWPVWLFWLLVVLMLAIAVLNTTVRMITRHNHGPGRPGLLFRLDRGL